MPGGFQAVLYALSGKCMFLSHYDQNVEKSSLLLGVLKVLSTGVDAHEGLNKYWSRPSIAESRPTEPADDGTHTLHRHALLSCRTRAESGSCGIKGQEQQSGQLAMRRARHMRWVQMPYFRERVTVAGIQRVK